MIPPGEWEEGQLPPGVMAESNIESGKITYSLSMRKMPPLVESAIILHEICHIRGRVTEYGADCCAAEVFSKVYGLPLTTAVVVFWQTNRKDAVVPWITCSF